MRHILSVLPVLLLLVSSCKKDPPMNSNPTGARCESELTKSGKVYQEGDKTMLWAGEDSDSHFDITNWTLRDCQLREYGFDRDLTPALTSPQYVLASSISDDYGSSEKTIVVTGEDVVKVFPYSQMAFHEVINDVVDGEPIMVAYCFLADLAAVYTRTYCEKDLTFGVSGYTYADEQVWEGIQAFVLWDRETESLWWPLIDIAVSGPMKKNELRKHTESKWGYLTWGEVSIQYPDALVIKPSQEWVPPTDLPQYACEDLECCN